MENCEECNGEVKRQSSESYCVSCGLVVEDAPIRNYMPHDGVGYGPAVNVDKMLEPTLIGYQKRYKKITW